MLASCLLKATELDTKAGHVDSGHYPIKLIYRINYEFFVHCKKSACAIGQNRSGVFVLFVTNRYDCVVINYNLGFLVQTHGFKMAESSVKIGRASCRERV